MVLDRLFLLVLLFFVSSCAAFNTLLTIVVADKPARLQLYAPFINKLREGGFRVDTSVYDDPNLSLDYYGEWRYGNVIILGGAIENFPLANNRPSFSTQVATYEKYIQFFDAGGNLIVLAEGDIKKDIRRLAIHCGVKFEVDGSRLYDFSSSSDGKSLTISSKEVLFTNFPSKAVLSASSIRTNTENNRLSRVIITATENSVLKVGQNTHIPITNETRHGSEAAIVTATRSNNNSLAVFASTLSLFRDVETKPGNWELVHDLIWWSCNRIKNLRTSPVRYQFLKGAPDNTKSQTEHPTFTQGDIIRIEVDIEENRFDFWHPYTEQVSFEIVKFKPLISGTLINNGVSKTHYVEVTLPDEFGVYKFELRHHNSAYSTPLSVSSQFTLRNRRHLDHPRFLLNALPYYISIALTLIFSVVFICRFLFFQTPAVILNEKKVQ